MSCPMGYTSNVNTDTAATPVNDESKLKLLEVIEHRYLWPDCKMREKHLKQCQIRVSKKDNQENGNNRFYIRTNTGSHCAYSSASLMQCYSERRDMQQVTNY